VERHVEITPEPGPLEREAVVVAVARLATTAQHPAYRSAWRRAGLEERPDGYAIARPRRTAGAKRA